MFMAGVLQVFIAAMALAAFVLHTLTFAPIDADLTVFMFPVHAGTMVAMFAAVGSLVLMQSSVGRSSSPRRRTSLLKLLSALPVPARVLLVVCFAYALVNWMLFMGNMGGGGPTQLDDGTYALTNHGQFLRSLTEAEYYQHLRWVLRGFSGHWMLGTVFPILVIHYRDRIREVLEATASEET